MKDLAILMNCFFNTNDIERTIQSIEQTHFPCDIFMLENPSKYSEQIRILKHKFPVYRYFICNENIESSIFQLFCKKYRSTIKNYKYIAMTESDVVLDKGALHEIIDLLDTSKEYVGLGSIDLHMNQAKYYNLPIYHWVPRPEIVDGYHTGSTGFQFIVFKQSTLLNFLEALDRKELSGGIALGAPVYHGISDTNLNIYVRNNNLLWIRTIYNKLDHIGWEHYIENNDEYVQLKNKNLNEQKIRYDVDLSNYTLMEFI